MKPRVCKCGSKLALNKNNSSNNRRLLATVLGKVCVCQEQVQLFQWGNARNVTTETAVPRVYEGGYHLPFCSPPLAVKPVTWQGEGLLKNRRI